MAFISIRLEEVWRLRACVVEILKLDSKVVKHGKPGVAMVIKQTQQFFKTMYLKVATNM